MALPQGQGKPQQQTKVKGVVEYPIAAPAGFRPYDLLHCATFSEKLAVHITKNFLERPKVKVPLTLGIHGHKGEGKTFQCELVYQTMGVCA
jgi:hypothetical protein